MNKQSTEDFSGSENALVWLNDTTLTPFCQLHLRTAVLFPRLSVFTKNAPRPGKFPINFYPYLHLI